MFNLISLFFLTRNTFRLSRAHVDWPSTSHCDGNSRFQKKGKEKEKVQARFMFYFPFNYDFVAALPLVEFAFHFPCGVGIYLFCNLLFILSHFKTKRPDLYELNHRLFLLLNSHRYYRIITDITQIQIERRLSPSLSLIFGHMLQFTQILTVMLSHLCGWGREKTWAIKILSASSAALVCP